MPSLTTSWLHSTGLALQRLAVKTLAESKVGPVVDDEGEVLAAGGLEAGGDAGGAEAAGMGDVMSIFCSRGSMGRRDGDDVSASSPRLGRSVGVLELDTRIQSVSKVESVKTLISRLGQRLQQRRRARR